jgi:MFS family permease
MSTTVMQPPQLSTARLLLLGASSVVLCLSFVMAVFAPFPMALAVILYGRLRGLLLSLAGLLVTFGYVLLSKGDMTLVVFYGTVILFGFGIAEIVSRGIPPVRGIVIFGLSFIGVVLGGFGLMLNGLKITPKDFVMDQLTKSWPEISKHRDLIAKSSEENALEVLQLLDKPELIASEMINTFPSYFFMGVFIMLWMNMFMVLKSRRLLYSGDDYKYSEKNLSNFRVPFGLVIVLAFGLALAVWGGELGSEVYEIVGLTIIKCLGVFYFFQGFGVFTELLNFAGLFGFFRVIIVVLTIFMGSYLVAVAGLFDNWFDFRKYFVKRKTED